MPKRIFQNSFFYFMAFVILSPLAVLVYQGLGVQSEIFAFLVRTVLDEVIANSLIITLLTGFGVLVIGVSTAWITVQYDFFGRSLFQFALFMPLAFPAYILAYVYTDFFDAAGSFSEILQLAELNFLLPDFRTLLGAAFILTFCLYPYVYLFARTAFLAGSQSQIESAEILGASRVSQFFNIALPSARPYIIVGLALVIMEVLADYGTMDYFGIRVFSTVIFDSWAGYGDITAAARMSLLLLGFVLLLIFLEKQQRTKVNYSAQDTSGTRKEGKKKGSVWLAVYCFLPIFIGFVFPLLVLAQMVFETTDMIQLLKTLPYMMNTLICAILVAILGVGIAFILSTQKRGAPDFTKRALFSICGFGYALPGIILGLGLLLMSSIFSTIGILVTGSFLFLILGYLIRFLNVALQGIEAGYDKMSPSIAEASHLLQRNAIDDLWHVKLPLLWPSMLSAGLILAVEVVKELPLTLVLRPFDFDTLAVHTYNLASDERLAEAAFPALCIVIAGCVPVILIQRLSRHA